MDFFYFVLEVNDVFIYLSIIDLVSMQTPKYFIAIVLFLFGYSTTINAQYGFSHEIGVIAGPVTFKSDYGERGDYDTNFGNAGYGIGLIYYLNFAYNSDSGFYAPETYFNDHFKVRSELSYNKTNLRHYGEYVSNDKKKLFNRQLRGMRGSTAVTNVGMQLEYFPLSIRDFTGTVGSLSPFVSLGGQFSFYNPEAYTTLGRLDNPATTPIKYIGATQNQGGTVWSVVGSVGTRYRLAPFSDLMLDIRVQHYFSDWVDGLNPNPSRYPENKANDWLVWFNVGYIYYVE